MKDSLLPLLKQLIATASVTPQDNGCQTLLIARLQASGFVIKQYPSGKVSNFWAKHGTGRPLLTFAGHTDVVASGPITEWQYPPFELTEKDGWLYGRGVADMKGSLAAMVTAATSFVADYPHHPGSIGFIITSGEEGDDYLQGTPIVMQALEEQQEVVDWCIVGEPSASEKTGDTIKIGRRGSLSGTLLVQGKQGHIAYPHLADNPIHRLAPALAVLTQQSWDQGNEDFPPTSFQISNIHAGTGAGNIIPGSCECQFNFRYSPQVTAQQLQDKTDHILQQQGLNYTLSWTHSGTPFYTKPGKLRQTAQQVISEISGLQTKLSTNGGTSDGRFIAPYGIEVLEIGPSNKTIHQIDESVRLSDLIQLRRIYYQLCKQLLL